MIKTFFKRIAKAFYRPSSFIIEYTINPDLIGPLMILSCYFVLGFLIKVASTKSFDNSLILLSFIQGSLNLNEALISVGTILFTMQIIKAKMQVKKDLGMFLYSFSVKVTSYAISLLVFLIPYIPSFYQTIVSQVLIGIATFWAILLQAYYMNKTKGIKFITGAFIALSAWLMSVLINDLISFEITYIIGNYS